MTKLMLALLVAATCRAETTGQDYRAWSEPFRQAYILGYLDGYLRGRNFAVDESTRLLLNNMSETTRSKVAPEVKAAVDKGLTENMGAICIGISQHESPMTYEQITAILDKYIADHPESWHNPMGQLAEVAFIQACEKRKKNDKQAER